MRSIVKDRTEQQVWKAVQELDLDPIKVKLMHGEEGLGWTLDQANEAERWYKRFLFLNFKYPEKSIVPTKVVDKFWHFHILDTQKYAEDCDRVFGYFLHHFPYFGMRGDEDAANLKAAFSDTCSILKSEFGEDAQVAGSCPDCDSSACDGQPSCGSSCSGQSSHHTERPRLSLA